MEWHQIPQFVADIIAAGGNIFAVGTAHYCIVEDDQNSDEVTQNVNSALKRFGDRNHLRLEIVQYLQDRGLSFELDEAIRPQTHA
jgi:S-adenosylmethionine:tRNA-ribosyltransferase-isomerase (queuine synthetase)